MTVLLDTDTRDDAPELLDVLSILAINAVAFCSIALGAHVAGLPLWLALLTGWLCGPAVTLVVAVLVVLFPVSALRRPARLQAPTPEPSVPPAWLEDARLEAREAALRPWQEDADREQTGQRRAA